MSLRLIEQLDTAARRARRVSRLTAAAWTLAVGLGVAVLLAAIDAAGRFSDPGLRWVFSAILLAAIGATLWRLRTAWEDRTDRLTIAQRLQRTRPELGSRLASAVEFVEQSSDEPSAGSEELRRAVVIDAESQAEGLDYRSSVDERPLRLAVRGLASAVLALAVFALVDAGALATGVARLAAPWSDLAWPRRTEMALVNPTTVLARGAPFEAIAKNAKGPTPADARIELRRPDGSVESQAMDLVGDQAVATIDRVDRSFSYRAVGGDDHTMRWVDLRVIDPPELERWKVEVAPPAYSGLPRDESPGTIRVLAGSRLRAVGETSKAIRTAKIEPINLDLVVAADQRTVAFEWEAVPGEPRSGYRVAMTGESGVVGRSKEWPYEVQPDSTPQPEWDASRHEEVATPRALLPIAGWVEDDLATARVHIEWARSGDDPSQADATGAAGQGGRRVTLIDNGAEPPAKETLGQTERIEIDQPWDLRPLGLEPGTELTLWLVATDYQPAEGRTEEPRRLLLVTDEQLEMRLAEQQSQLLGEAQHALDLQRTATQATRDLRIDARDRPIGQAEADRIASIEFEQRQAAGAIGDPSAGVRRRLEQLTQRIEQNRLDRPDLLRQLTRASEALRGLAEERLPEAQRGLAGARREAPRAQREPAARERFDRALAGSEEEQSAAIETLEGVIESLAGWSDYQRFAKELSELETRERDLAERSAAAAATAVNDALRSIKQKAAREKLLGMQAEVSRRFARLSEAMSRLVGRGDEQSDAAPDRARAAVEDALDVAVDRDVAGGLRDAARELALGRLGAASSRQVVAAEGLSAMLDALLSRTSDDPEQIVKQLREAQEQLRELQRRVEQLRRQTPGLARRAERRRMEQQAERISRRLERLAAQQAASSASQGAQQAGDPQDDQQSLAQAEQSFERAQQEIERRLDELENQQTQRLLDRLAELIGGFIERQEGTLQQTERLDALLQIDAESERDRVAAESTGLAQSQATLARDLDGFAGELAKRAVFEMALRSAAGQMTRASQRLERSLVDRPTQRFEESALRKLRRIADVLEENQQLAQQGGGQGGGSGQGGQQPPPSPVDVAELKMLRLMQLEVLDDTDLLEADLAEAERRGTPPPEGADQISRKLIDQQRRLAELALEMSRRNNDPEAPPSP